MIGRQKKQEGLFCYGVRLEDRIPDTHPLRPLKRVLDLSFVREAVFSFYGCNGNVSVAPEVIVKLMLLLFLDDIPSERELMRTLPYRLDYLWFLDFGLDDEIPNHSVLSKARSRWGSALFEKLFVVSVKQCVDAGLVDGRKLYVDGSLVDADASCKSVKKGSPELLSALSRAYHREEKKLDDLSGEAAGSGGCGGSGGGEPGAKSGYQPVNENLMSMTDPDAAVVRHGSMPARPRYKNHRAVDDACGVITAVETTSGDVAENRKLVDMVEASESNTGIEVDTVVGDSQYGTADNFRRLGRLGIKAHLGDLRDKQKRRGGGIFRDDQFSYDPLRDIYLCPAGNGLKRRHHKPWRKAYYYGCSPKLCNRCELKSKCTRAETGRTVIRHEGQEIIDRARTEAHSYASKLDQKKRKHKSEVSFADAANNHGFKRSRWRGLWRQKIQDYLIALCQNLRILVSIGTGRSREAMIRVRIITLPSAVGRIFHRIFDRWIGFWPGAEFETEN